VIVVIDKFAYHVDFVVLEMEDPSEVVILGRAFLATAGAIIDVKGSTIKLRFGNEDILFDMKHASHLPAINSDCYSIDVVDRCIKQSHKECGNQVEFDEILLHQLEKEFIEETFMFEQVDEVEILKPKPKKVELKPLPDHVMYQFLDSDERSPIIVSSLLKVHGAPMCGFGN
jgi:hypothetical protein